MKPTPSEVAPVKDDAGSPAIELTRISKTFDGVTVLSELHLVVERGGTHAIVGGNGSGKSTTLKTLAGVYMADPGGKIAINGREHDAGSWTPELAYDAGLRFVHQDLGLVEDLTVAENFGLANGFPCNALGGIAWRRLQRSTAAALAALDIAVAPQQRVEQLRPSEKTMVAIARSLATAGSSSDITIVLDEPTASLPKAEVDLLLAALSECRDRGQTIVYVSHRLPEVFSVANRVSVLRDGQLVADEPAGRIDERAVISLMSANAEPVASPPIAHPATGRGPVVLRIEGLTAGPLADLDLTVHAGEIVGLAGLTGSGRTTLLRTVFGQQKASAGTITLGGVPLRASSPAEAMANGLAFVPEDRKHDALFADQPVWENVSAAVMADYWRRGSFDRRSERADSAGLMREFRVKASSPDAPIRSLSGGNQQKAMMARWLRRAPKVLLLDEPSQGVDAVARAEIHELIRAHVARANTAVVVSSDIAELVELSDRVVVLRNGRSVRELSGDGLTEDRVSYLTQFESEESLDEQR